MKKLYFVIAIMVAILLGNVDMKSQGTCLCSNVAPSTPPWSGYTCDWIYVTMPNSSVCYTYVCWCTRVVSGVTQFCVNGGGCDPGCYDLEANPGEADGYFRSIGAALIKEKYNPNPCPTCLSTVTVVEVVNSSCMKIVHDTVNQIDAFERCNDDGYCKRTYTMCCSALNGAKIVTYVSVEAIGSSCTGWDYEHGCFPVCYE